MSELLWRLIARWATRHPTWLIERAMRTPYEHLSGYMNRYWLFNGYSKDDDLIETKNISWLPSIRIHHIKRADLERWPHDHPWIRARSIPLLGWLKEERTIGFSGENPSIVIETVRRAGDTYTLNNGEFHRIIEVSPGGVWTLFITWKQTSNWGFLVNGKKIPWREYKRMQESTSLG